MASALIARSDGAVASSFRNSGAWGIEQWEQFADVPWVAEDQAERKEVPVITRGGLTIPTQAWTIVAVLVAGLSYWLATALAASSGLSPDAGKLVAGVGPFTLLYIATQAIERLLELFSGLLGFKKTAAKAAEDKIAEAANAPTKEQALKPATEAAAAQDQVDRITQMRTVLLWSAATSLGFLASALVGVYLLQLVLQTAPDIRLDIFVTGLVIGGGTKPLHDLISKIQKSKDADAATPGTKPGAK
jgi:hypothetical protein